MNREEIALDIKKSLGENECLILELPTGFGKTKLSLDAILYKNAKEILILVAQKVHIKNWQDEIDKWELPKGINFHFECYNSIKKHASKLYDMVILDEAHHLSELRRLFLKQINVRENIIALSATLSKDLKQWFMCNYNTKIIKESLQTAIDNDILPEPQILLFPLELRDNGLTETYVKNVKQSNKIEVDIKDLNKVIWRKDVRIECKMTRTQYLNQINRDIEIYKDSTMRGNQWARNIWLKKAGERLKWLAEQKESEVKKILENLSSQRVLTFCTSIEQTNTLGKNSINSQRGNNQEVIDAFNQGKINHITACDMLNEGVNLKECKYGILVRLNSSERITVQRIGRILRHKEPVIIIPYFINTREQEIVERIIEPYDWKQVKQLYLK